MPFCPFKREHDDLQIYHRKIDYWDSDLGMLSCIRWKNILGVFTVPRTGTNCFWSSVDTFKEYAELVDIFKSGGRLSIIPQGFANLQWGWLFGDRAAVRSFSEIIENRLEPVHLWCFGPPIYPGLKTNIKDIKEDLKDNFWLTDEGKRLEQRLRNCKNQCYKCHLCERAFRIPEIDSVLEL